MVRRRIKRISRISRYVVYRETLVDPKEHFWSFLGAFVGIGCLGWLQSRYAATDQVMLIGSFGASSVLVYGSIQSPLAQPRNLVGGHLVSALIGVTAQQFLPDILWLKAASAVSLAIVFMQVTRTLHPPGGATALIAVIGTEKVKALGYWYVVTPVFTGSLILLLTALIFNNMTSRRVYPVRTKYPRIVRSTIHKLRPGKR